MNSLPAFVFTPLTPPWGRTKQRLSEASLFSGLGENKIKELGCNLITLYEESEHNIT